MSFLKDCYLTDEPTLCGTWENKNNGKKSTVCYNVADCKKFQICFCMKIPKEKLKLRYAKCCGVCDNASFCKYLRSKKKFKNKQLEMRLEEWKNV